MNIDKINKIENKEKNHINKGSRIFPDLDTAILANLRGCVNGSYSEPLSGAAEKLGYYPLSMAAEDEKIEINKIKKQILNGE